MCASCERERTTYPKHKAVWPAIGTLATLAADSASQLRTPEEAGHMKDRFMAPTMGRLVALTVIAWLSMLGVDFLVHGGLLAELYQQPSPFLLPPASAFARIPLGYLAFLLLAVLLVWLLLRLKLAGWQSGALFGGGAGRTPVGRCRVGLALHLDGYFALADWLVCRADSGIGDRGGDRWEWVSGQAHAMARGGSCGVGRALCQCDDHPPVVWRGAHYPPALMRVPACGSLTGDLPASAGAIYPCRCAPVPAGAQSWKGYERC